MTVDQAIEEAKSYVRKAFSGESVSQIRLEEVEFDEHADSWLVTVGITRPSAMELPSLGSLRPEALPLKRTYKVVKIPNGSGVPSIKIRDLAIDE